MKTAITFFISFQFLFLSGQNLVPNPSFEDTLGCPMFYPDLEGICEHWYSYSGTCDYMNNCSSVCGYNNQYGYQEPHSGAAYAGILAYHKNIPDAREHLGIELLEPVEVGTTYYVSFYVCTAWNNLLANISCNKMGALLTTYSYNEPEGLQPLPNVATITEEAIISDTLQWTQIFSSFVADSAYSHLIIGNFFEDALLDTLNLPYQVVPQISYYYVDDICLSSDSAYASNWTFVGDIHDDETNVFIYPNPASGVANVAAEAEVQHIRMFNSLGQLVLEKESKGKTKLQIECAHFNKGTYHLVLQTPKGPLHALLQIE